MRAWLRRRLDLVCGPTPLVPGMWWFGTSHRATILAALEDAAAYRLDQANCPSCKALADFGLQCTDHDIDEAIARSYDDLTVRIQGQPPRRRKRLPRQLALAQVEDAMIRAETAHINRQVR